MKLNLFTVCTFLMLTMGFVSCSDDKETVFNFELESNSWQIFLEESSNYPVKSGNGSYTFHIADPQIISASFNSQMYGFSFGAIQVKGLQKGETTLGITDNVTERRIDVKVKVTDSYLGYLITESDHPALTEKCAAYFINNEEKDIYFYSTDTGAPDKLLAKGKYEFAVESGKRYLKLWYPEDEQGRFTFLAVVPTLHTFDITDNEGRVLDLLSRLLAFDWDKLAEPRMNITPPYKLGMIDEESGKRMIGSLGYQQIPEDMFD